MSTFDIPPPRPKIIIRQLRSSAAAAPGYEYPAPPTHLLFNLRLTFISVSPSHCLLCHSSAHLFLIFFFSYSLYLIVPHPSRASSASFRCTRRLLFRMQSAPFFAPSRLNRASSVAATIPLSFICFPFTLYSLSPLLQPIYLSACQLFLPFVNLFPPSTPLNVSVCVRWPRSFSLRPRPRSASPRRLPLHPSPRSTLRR